MEGMRGYPDNYFELAIVDPPYGIGVNKINIGSRLTVKPDDRVWDKEKPQREYFKQLLRISKNEIIFGANNFISQFLPSMDSRCWIIWDKGEGLYGRSFAECELAYTSFNASARLYKQNPIQLERIHPTQKPVKLYEWILKNYAKAGDKILDTHLGSGSSVIACYNLDFQITGFELDEEYFMAMEKRIEHHISQRRLFDAV